MKLYISNPENVKLPSENSVNIFIDGETSTLKGKMVDSSILEFSKTIEVEPDFSSMGITVSSSDVKTGKYFIDSTGTLVEGSLNESSYSINNNEVIVSDGFIDETQTIQVGTLYSGSNELIPGTEDQTLNPNTFINENIIIKGDSNLLAENIKSGVVIFGITGTFDGSDSGESGGNSGEKVYGYTVTFEAYPDANGDYWENGYGEAGFKNYINANGWRLEYYKMPGGRTMWYILTPSGTSTAESVSNGGTPDEGTWYYNSAFSTVVTVTAYVPRSIRRQRKQR